VTLSLVVAYARNGVIGRDGGLPWHLPTDLKHFRELTGGGTVLMGRRTWGSIPEKFRPLPGRRNLVLSRDAGFAAPGASVFGTLDEALAACGGDCFVIGGGATYLETLPLAGEVWATEIDADVEGDTVFPALDAASWSLADSLPPVAENGFSFTIKRYERRA
jgi:dihydrofolate reductase